MIFVGVGMGQAANTIGLVFTSPEADAGYTLFPPSTSRHTYLIDGQGQLINRWTSSFLAGHSAYLLENGHLLRSGRDPEPSFPAGGRGGRVEEFDWNGQLLWSFSYATTEHRQHHDSIKLPNGNILMIAWELKTAAQAVAAGRNPGLIVEGVVWPDTLVEVEPVGANGGNVVWIWRAWDHLIQDYDPSKPNYGVVTDHPERIDLNFAPSARADWLHFNGIDYHPGLDQIVISVHGWDEIWIVDHSTTTEEAAGTSGGRIGRGGDLLYRWGNPAAYRRGAPGSQKLFGQHNPHWIRPGLPGEGNLLIFNNGNGRVGGNYSTVDELAPPLDAKGAYGLEPGTAYGPTNLVWTYVDTPPSSFYGMNISGCQRLANGHTLICEGPRGIFFEVTPEGMDVWRYICPVGVAGVLTQGSAPPNTNPVFRAPRYPPDYAGLAGRDLTPHGTVELPVGPTFEITDIRLEEGGTRMIWNSLPDVTYQIHYRLDLDTSVWAPIATHRAIGSQTYFLDAEPGRAESRSGFYQVSRP